MPTPAISWYILPTTFSLLVKIYSYKRVQLTRSTDITRLKQVRYIIPRVLSDEELCFRLHCSSSPTHTRRVSCRSWAAALEILRRFSWNWNVSVNLEIHHLAHDLYTNAASCRAHLSFIRYRPICESVRGNLIVGSERWFRHSLRSQMIIDLSVNNYYS